MRDEGAIVEPNIGLSASEEAVLYVLRRTKLDANLRHYMLGTEAFARLCAAEAERANQREYDVREFYSRLADHCKDDVADVVTLRDKVDKLGDTTAVERGIQDKQGEIRWLKNKLQKIREVLQDAKYAKATPNLLDDIGRILEER